MKIAVTGSSGFIGRHLTSALVNAGYEVIGIDHIPAEGIKFYHEDCSDSAAYELERPQVVIHLAGQTSVRDSITHPIQDAIDNIFTTLEVLDRCKQAGVKRFIFASSGGAVYGNGIRLTEQSPTEPTSPYGLSKLTCEKYLRMLCAPMDLTILRLSNVYGYGGRGVMNAFAECAKAGRMATIYGDGEQQRDYIHVSDVCDAFLKAIDGPAGTYNIGTGMAFSVNHILTSMKLGAAHHPAIDGELRKNSLDASKARLELGWEYKIGPGTGIKELLQ